MALRFLADSNTTIQTIREANHEVLRLKDVLPVESSDMVVITKAQEIDAILLSLNGDFSHIVNYPPKNYKGIVALQMHNHAEILPKLIARLTAYLKVNTTMDQLGCTKTSRGFLRAPRVAIGAVKLQPVTSGRWTVTAEVASSSLVVPAIHSKKVERSSLQPTRVQKGAFLHPFCIPF